MINHKKIYEHIDIINPINYFKKIEKIADKTNEWSIKILLKDIENNMDFKNNDNYLKFKNNIEYNVKKMDDNFNLGNVFLIESLNMKCLDMFYEFINIEKIKTINNKDIEYYIMLKNKMYKILSTINKMTNKIKEIDNYKKKIIIENIIKEIIREYIIIVNNIKLYYLNNKDLIPYEDLLLINFKYINDANFILEYKKESLKCYNEFKLPIQIIEIKIYNKYLCKNFFVYLTIYNTFLDIYKIIYRIYNIDCKIIIKVVKNNIKDNNHKIIKIIKLSNFKEVALSKIKDNIYKLNNNLIINKCIFLNYKTNILFILNKKMLKSTSTILDYG